MKRTRREFITSLGGAVAFSAFPNLLLPSESRRQKPYNFLFVLTDDLGYGDLQCYGHPHIRTPYLDLLAKEGLRLTHCYSPSPLCSPARAGFLTGRTPYRTGIKSWIPEGTEVFLRRPERTLATILKENGYETFLGGKWHLCGKFNSPEHPQPDDHGFDHWLATPNFTRPTHRNPTNFVRNGEALGEIEGYAAQIVVDEAVQWLEGRTSNQPFFQYVCLHEPHSEIASPRRFERIYQDLTEGAADPSTLTDRGPGEYYANVTHLDYQVGRLLKAIDRMGMRRDTFVFFTSDNGPVTENWRHWWEVNMYGSTGGLHGRKADLYEGGIRVPGIMRLPGRIEAGSVSDTPVHGCDLSPTVCGLTGASVPADRPIDGDDMSPVFQGRRIDRKQPLYWQFTTFDTHHFGDSPFLGQYAVRDGDWKLIADESMENFELFNLRNDPAESRNVAESERGQLQRLRDKMDAINESVRSDPLAS